MYSVESRQPFQRFELEAYIGYENLYDYDVEGIIDRVTYIDYYDNVRCWRDGYVNNGKALAEILDLYRFDSDD